MANPYDPQNPAKPNYFGGRHAVLTKVQERIDRALTQKQSGGILIYGFRGVGKTSLLNKIRSIIEPDVREPNKNTIVISRRLSRTTNDEELYRILVESLVDEIERRKTSFEKVTEKASTVKSISFAQFQVAFSIRKGERSEFSRWQTAVRALKNTELVIIEIDDADYLSVEAISELKTIVEHTTHVPLLVVVSGGADFNKKLVNDFSPIARVFSGAAFNIGEFSQEETREVLELPLKNEATRWTQDAIQTVHKLSKGYPYLVQCLASASYTENREIEKKYVVDALKQALDIGKPWFENELVDASDNDIISFAKIADSGKTTLKSTEITTDLGISPIYIGRLVKLKVIEKINRGRYTLIKAPIIAQYHLLKRGLKTK